jgi:hypothetical protein
MSANKERALSILATAKNLHDPTDICNLIDKAILHLRDEPELVAAMELTVDMIYEALGRLSVNIPKPSDTLHERSTKIHICESALLQIADYAKSGLKARQSGALEHAEAARQAQINHGLHEYADAEVEITGSDGKKVKTTFGQFEKAAEAIQRDPSIAGGLN